MTGPWCSGSFRLCLDGLRLAREIFQNTIGAGLGSLCEPIKHLRRGVQIQVVAPKVPAYDAVSASGAIECAELIELRSYLRDPGGMQCVYLFVPRSTQSPHHVIRRQQMSPFSEKNAYLVGSFIITKSQHGRPMHCCTTGVHPWVVGSE